MSWRPTDCHAHSTHSDGSMSVAEVAERGAALGVRVSVSDHISRDAPTTLTSVEAIDSYLTDLEQYDVLRGGEFCWHDALWRELPDALVARFTHRLGSLHSVALPGGASCRAFVRELPPGVTPAMYVEGLVTSLEQLAREMPVDILAHPTIIPPAARVLDPETLWTEELEDRVVAALASSGIAFELSARYAPHRRLVERIASAGIRFSLGSDGHLREQVGVITAPLELARSIGVKDQELYNPEVHGSRTGAFGA